MNTARRLIHLPCGLDWKGEIQYEVESSGGIFVCQSLTPVVATGLAQSQEDAVENLFTAVRNALNASLRRGEIPEGVDYAGGLANLEAEVLSLFPDATPVEHSEDFEWEVQSGWVSYKWNNWHYCVDQGSGTGQTLRLAIQAYADARMMEHTELTREANQQKEAADAALRILEGGCESPE
jgi:hypothetical protein